MATKSRFKKTPPKFILTGVLPHTGENFLKEAKSLDEVTEAGIYMLTGNNVSSADGLPNVVGSATHSFDAQLIVTSNMGENSTKDKGVKGQILILSNLNDGTTNIFTRTWKEKNVNDGEWTPWLMMLGGDISVVAPSNEIAEKVSVLSTTINSEIKRSQEAEKANADAITSEVTRAKAAEYENAVNIWEQQRTIRPDGENLTFTDEKGHVVAMLDDKGFSAVNIVNDNTDEFSISDSRGNVVAFFDKEGLHHVGESKQMSGTLLDSGNTRTDVVYNILYGQSLSYHGQITQGADMHTCLQFDTTTGNYMLLELTNDVLNDQSQVDAYFKGLIPSKTNISGTGIAHANRMFMELLRDENGIDIDFDEEGNPRFYFQLLGCSAGEVSSWGGLTNPAGALYRRLLESVRQAKKFAEQENKTFSVGCVCYMQGENGADKNDSIKAMYDKLWVLATNLNNDIKNITGQQNDILFSPYQVASTVGNGVSAIAVPMAQLQLSIDSGSAPEGYTLDAAAQAYYRSDIPLTDRKNIVMGAIMNSLDYSSSSDHVHATQHSYIAAGAQWGVQLKRSLYDEQAITPIHVAAHNVSQRADGSYMIVLKFHVPVKPLLFDTGHNECQSARATSEFYGFRLPNSAGTDIITGVFLRRGEEILIITNENPAGLKLTYAVDGWESGGNLRDSQNIQYNMGGFNYTVHNWCPTFELTL